MQTYNVTCPEWSHLVISVVDRPLHCSLFGFSSLTTESSRALLPCRVSPLTLNQIHQGWPRTSLFECDFIDSHAKLTFQERPRTRAPVPPTITPDSHLMIEGYLAVPGSESHSILIDTLTYVALSNRRWTRCQASDHRRIARYAKRWRGETTAAARFSRR